MYQWGCINSNSVYIICDVTWNVYFYFYFFFSESSFHILPSQAQATLFQDFLLRANKYSRLQMLGESTETDIKLILIEVSEFWGWEAGSLWKGWCTALPPELKDLAGTFNVADQILFNYPCEYLIGVYSISCILPKENSKQYWRGASLSMHRFRIDQKGKLLPSWYFVYKQVLEDFLFNALILFVFRFYTYQDCKYKAYSCCFVGGQSYRSHMVLAS